jgi:hypothetical protein
LTTGPDAAAAGEPDDPELAGAVVAADVDVDVDDDELLQAASASAAAIPQASSDVRLVTGPNIIHASSAMSCPCGLTRLDPPARYAMCWYSKITTAVLRTISRMQPRHQDQDKLSI